MEVTPHPPVRRWQEELDPAAQLGPYQPPVVLLDLLARLLGAESYAAADEPRRRRIRAAAEQIRSAGLDPRVIGLVTGSAASSAGDASDAGPDAGSDWCSGSG